MSKNKDDIAELVAEKIDRPKAEAKKAVDAVLASIKESLGKGEEIRFPGFGTFKVSETAARTGRNPQTGQPIEIAAGKKVSFSAGKELKDAL